MAASTRYYVFKIFQWAVALVVGAVTKLTFIPVGAVQKNPAIGVAIRVGIVLIVLLFLQFFAPKKGQRSSQ